MIIKKNLIGTEIKGDCFHAFAIAQGVKNRCRKIESHYIDIGFFKLETKPETILEIAHAKITEEMKTTIKAKLELQYTERTDFGESFQMFDPRSISLPVTI